MLFFIITFYKQPNFFIPFSSLFYTFIDFNSNNIHVKKLKLIKLTLI